MGAPGDDPLAYKDAIFLSPHKFIDGTPGVLVVRQGCSATGCRRSRAAAPSPTSTRPAPLPRRPGGARGGRQLIVESIRAGLVFNQQAVGADTIAALEQSFIRRAIGSWGANPSIELLGNLEAEERLSIVSFVVRRPPLPAPQLRRGPAQRPVRHPVAGRLLLRRTLRPPAAGHRHGAVALLRAEIARGCEHQAGWVRVNFNYFISEAVFEYLLEYVHLVADQGWACSGTTASTRPAACGGTGGAPVEPPLRLHALRYDDDGSTAAPLMPPPPTPLCPATSTRPAACWPPPPPATATAPPATARPVGRLRGAALVRAPPGVPLAVQQPELKVSASVSSDILA